MAAHEALSRIKSDSEFIERIFAAKAARETAQEEVSIQEDAMAQESTFMPMTEETEKSDIAEQIINEAEEAAFKETF